jgi:hypothetical protein
MGISGGSTSRSGSAQKWAAPLAQNAARDATSVYNAAKPGLDAITGSVQSLIPGLAAKYQAGDPNVAGATAYGQNVLGGKYLTGNPFATPNTSISSVATANPYINPNGFLQSIIDQTNSDVTNSTKAGFGSRGSFGGTAYIKALSDSLAKNENNLRYTDANTVRGMQVDDFNRLQADAARVQGLQVDDAARVRDLNAGNYATERAAQEAAASRAPQLAAADYLGISPLLSASELGSQLPFAGASSYADILGQLFNGGTQKTSGGIGGILGGLGSLASGAGSLGMKV